MILWLQAQKKKETPGTDAYLFTVRDYIKVDIRAYIGKHIGKDTQGKQASLHKSKPIVQGLTHQAIHSLTLARHIMLNAIGA